MIDWQEMLKMHQELNQFARIMLTKKQKEFLTSSERELLVWIYLNNGECTPLYLSKASGMKKEAVSRCIKSLLEKGCVERKRSKIDERSYFPAPLPSNFFGTLSGSKRAGSKLLRSCHALSSARKVDSLLSCSK